MIEALDKGVEGGKWYSLIDPDPKLLIGELSTELPTAGACLAGVFEYPPHAPTMDNSPWYFMLPPVL
jgi:hypothetical protein